MSNKLWDRLVVELSKKHVDYNFSALSPQKDADIVFYILKKTSITEYALFEALSITIGLEVFKDDILFDKNDYYSEGGFLLTNDNAYFVNPFDRKQYIIADEVARRESRIIKKIGIISRNSIYLSKSLSNAYKDKVDISNESNAELFLKRLLKLAIDVGSSDVHIFPRNEESIYFRFRVDGILQTGYISDLGIYKYQFLANILITSAGGESGNFMKLLDGSFDFKEKMYDCNIRLSMMPSIYTFPNSGAICPRFVLRIHNSQSVRNKLITQFGFLPEHEKLLIKLTKFNQGLIVVTGPTGSGKTTLLYSFLNEILKNRPGISIQTLEDPVEKILHSIEQVNINNDSGLNYASGLKSFLRSDIDCALIGEIRDEETALKVIEIAMTGHLALSTLHTKTSLSTISRMTRLGINQRDLADVLVSTIASRLVRKVCQHCSIEKKIIEDEYLVEGYGELIENNLKDKIKYANYKGCGKCNNGYTSRVLVAEVFLLNQEALEMITESVALVKIQKNLEDEGQKGIWHHGIYILLKGLTTIEELEAKLPPYYKNM